MAIAAAVLADSPSNPVEGRLRRDCIVRGSQRNLEDGLSQVRTAFFTKNLNTHQQVSPTSPSSAFDKALRFRQ
jgi:hypothetical protein